MDLYWRGIQLFSKSRTWHHLNTPIFGFLFAQFFVTKFLICFRGYHWSKNILHNESRSSKKCLGLRLIERLKAAYDLLFLQPLHYAISGGWPFMGIVIMNFKTLFVFCRFYTARNCMLISNVYSFCTELHVLIRSIHSLRDKSHHDH